MAEKRELMYYIPIILLLYLVISFWYRYFRGDFSGFGGLMFFPYVFLILVVGISSIIVYSSEKNPDFKNRLFFNASIAFLGSPLLIYLFAGIIIRFIRRIFYLFGASTNFIYTNSFFIFCGIVLFIILMICIYSITSLNEIIPNKIVIIISIITVIFLMFAVGDNYLEKIVYNCNSSDKCMLNRALAKDSVAECAYFFSGDKRTDIYQDNSCIENYVIQKKIAPEDCKGITNDIDLFNYCLSKTFQNFTPNSSSDVDSCEILDSQGFISAKDRCYTNLAKNIQSIDICEKITHDIAKIYCKDDVYFAIAIEQLSVDQCEYMEANLKNLTGQPYESSPKYYCTQVVPIYKEMFDSAVQLGNLEDCEKLGIIPNYEQKVIIDPILNQKMIEKCKTAISNN